MSPLLHLFYQTLSWGLTHSPWTLQDHIAVHTQMLRRVTPWWAGVYKLSLHIAIMTLPTYLRAPHLCH